MFETIRELDDEQIDTAAKTLDKGGVAMCLIDPSGVYVAVIPTAGKPGEADFCCVTAEPGRGFKSFGMPIESYNVVKVWTEKAWKAISARWQEILRAKKG